jgi:hypothetical protein
MTSELYSEGIGEVAITGSVVRLDLLTLSLEERDDKGQPKLVLRKRVVMPIDGFLRSYAVLTQAMKELEKKGVIRKLEQAGQDVGSTTVAPASGKLGRSSPNFK